MIEPVVLERLRRDATCIIIRLDLGGFELRGPARNLLVPESRVAYATVRHELAAEGYGLVAPQTYADVCGLALEEVQARLHREGSLFALVYGDETLVALPEKEAVLPEIEV